MRPLTLEDYDRDGSCISSLEEAEALARVEGIAIDNALLVHPITRFVRRVPFESSLYPAISESSLSLCKLVTGRSPVTRQQIATRAASQNRDHLPNMVWSLPGQDDRPGCGVRRSDDGRLPLKMCMEDPHDFIRAISNHCGSFRCKSCMNYAAMMSGLRIEDRICTPADLRGRASGFYDRPKHWAVSPPQDWMKRVMQRSDTFASLVDDLCALLPAYGFDTGVIVFHPWRLSEDRRLWVLSPHFHVVGYGHFDNMGLRRDLAEADAAVGGIWDDDGRSESWVFNQIHPGEEMRSVRHTLGYIFTHVGIGSFDHDVDFTDADDDLTIPREAGSKTSVRAKTIHPEVYEADWKATGCYAEHLSEVDWVSYHMSKACSTFQTYRIFGSANRTRIFDVNVERVERLCPECGARIGLFKGFGDQDPEPVVYSHRSVIRCWKDDKPMLDDYWSSHRDDFFDRGFTKLNLGLSVPQLSTPETKGLQELRTEHTPAESAAIRERCLVYRPVVEHDCPGFRPMVVTRAEAEELRRLGEIV